MFDGIIYTIQEVRHVKDLKQNLLSLKQIDNIGCKTYMKNEIVKVVRVVLVSVLICSCLKGKCYRKFDGCVTSTGEESVTMWHHKLGHML